MSDKVRGALERDFAAYAKTVQPGSGKHPEPDPAERRSSDPGPSAPRPRASSCSPRTRPAIPHGSTPSESAQRTLHRRPGPRRRTRSPRPGEVPGATTDTVADHDIRVTAARLTGPLTPRWRSVRHLDDDPGHHELRTSPQEGRPITTTLPAAAQPYVGGSGCRRPETRPVVDPGTGRPFAAAAVAGPDVARPRSRPPGRPSTTVRGGPGRRAERAALLRRVADDIAGRNLELIELDCQNVGTPIIQGRDHLGLVPSVFRYYADLIEEQAADGPQSVGIERLGRRARAGRRRRRDRPLELSALVGERQGVGRHRRGLHRRPQAVEPDAVDRRRAGAGVRSRRGAARVFNVVLGPSATVGTALTSDPRVDKVSFTGGTGPDWTSPAT